MCCFYLFLRSMLPAAVYRLFLACRFLVQLHTFVHEVCFYLKAVFFCMYLHARELSVHAENWRQPSIVAPVICLCYITECGCDFLRVCFVKQRSHSCHIHFQLICVWYVLAFIVCSLQTQVIGKRCLYYVYCLCSFRGNKLMSSQRSSCMPVSVV